MNYSSNFIRGVIFYFITLWNYGTKNILIKASGDVVETDDFKERCKEIARSTRGKVVVISGSGKQINTKLTTSGYVVEYDSLGERKICCEAAENIVKDTLKNTRDKLASEFWQHENIHVKGSWEEINGVYCHINADTLIFTYYLGFSEIYVFTFQGNGSKKREIFAKYPKVQIIEL